MAKKLYTVGYLNLSSSALLFQFAAAHGLAVVDIRLKPRSRKPGWSQSALSATGREAGARYYINPDMGNVNYHSPDQPIVLNNVVAGLTILENIMEESEGGAILLCACRNFATCHREEVIRIYLSANQDSTYEGDLNDQSLLELLR